MKGLRATFLQTCVMKISASEEAGPAGAANGGRGEGVGELRPTLRDQPPGGLQGPGPAHGDVLVVCQDDHYVRPPLSPRHASLATCHAHTQDEVECQAS